MMTPRGYEELVGMVIGVVVAGECGGRGRGGDYCCFYCLEVAVVVGAGARMRGLVIVKIVFTVILERGGVGTVAAAVVAQ